MKSTLTKIALGFAGTIVVLAAVAAGLTLSFTRSERICRDVTVSGVAIGGMPVAEARAKLDAWAIERTRRDITLTALNTRWKGTAQEFGASVDTKSAIAGALRVGRTGDIFSRAVRALTPWGRGKRLSAPTVVEGPRAKHTLSLIAKKVNRPHKDATIKAINGRLEIVPDGFGIKLNQDKALAMVTRAVTSGRAVVSLPVEVDQPNITTDDAMGIDTLLARFTTSFNPGKVGRTHNLTLASRCINGAILKPGMPLSVNKTVGPRLMNRGFRTAPIFVKGRLEDGLGGGVCQVSTTLYNAVLLAGLKVLERNHHSRTVPYVSPGRDATVAYGLQDFRFENSNTAPIGILAQVHGSRLTVDIYGSAADKKTISIFTSESRRTPSGVKTTTDAALAAGRRKIIDKGSRGVNVTVYRKVTQPDGTVKTEVVSRDRYVPQSAIVAVGPTPASAEPAPLSADAPPSRTN